MEETPADPGMGAAGAEEGIAASTQEQGLGVLGEGARQAEEGAGGAAGRVYACRTWKDLAGTGSCLVVFQILGTVTVSAQNSGRDAQVCVAKLLQEETRGGQGQSCV